MNEKVNNDCYVKYFGYIDFYLFVIWIKIS